MAQQQKALILLSKDAGKLTLSSRPIPTPGPGEILIKNMAVALNPIDAFIEKLGIIVQDFPAVLGCDGAGVIEQVGEGVTGWSVGDRVHAFLPPHSHATDTHYKCQILSGRGQTELRLHHLPGIHDQQREAH
jgi:NADPH:quinone reductase-like Zn-dependent oxidoreductase